MRERIEHFPSEPITAENVAKLLLEAAAPFADEPERIEGLVSMMLSLKEVVALRDNMDARSIERRQTHLAKRAQNQIDELRRVIPLIIAERLKLEINKGFQFIPYDQAANLRKSTNCRACLRPS